ncbi:MAG TPA: hypoxanthine phosphoribosyltransferase, partial [Propionicimonas sp.]|nr:hypoxanthine phosphoribosyltransferase [Propionicimonas sp.]
MDAADMAGDLAEVLFSKSAIAARLTELAAEIDADYRDLNPLLVGVLNGAVMVMADLSRALHIDCAMDWMAI